MQVVCFIFANLKRLTKRKKHQISVDSFMEKSFGLLIAVTASVAYSSGLAASSGKTLNICHFRQTFSDEFDKLSVTSSNNEKAKWSAHTPWNGDFGDARFIDPIDIYADVEKNEPFIVSGGFLKIRARKHENGKWTSGLLSSADATTAGFAQTYGYFEARMKLPPGPGVWPAFWLATSSKNEDKSPQIEIDVLEYYGQFAGIIHSVLHVWDRSTPEKSWGKEIVTNVPEGSLTSSFHTYGVNVTKEHITFYLDRVEIGNLETPKEHTRPLLILLNLALGSGWPIDKTPNPSELVIDYVRAYELDETKSPSGDGGKDNCIP